MKNAMLVPADKDW